MATDIDSLLTTMINLLGRACFNLSIILGVIAFLLAIEIHFLLIVILRYRVTDEDLLTIKEEKE